MDYLIGIDAGGTKTLAQSYSLDGVLLNESKTSFGNVTVDFKQGLVNIIKAIDLLLLQHKEDNCIFICLGCAGIESGNYKQLVYEALTNKYHTKVKVMSDALLALYAALEGRDGILTISGTGSVAFLKEKDFLKRVGGWGHLINDDGSGYSIAIKAIRFIGYGYDTGNFETPLKKAVFKFLNINTFGELVEYTYTNPKSKVAALVPIIEELAQKGDKQAYEILEWAGVKIAFLSINLCRQSHLSCPDIALSGSIIKKIPVVKKVYLETLKSEVNNFNIIDTNFDPPKGCYYYYLEKIK